MFIEIRTFISDLISDYKKVNPEISKKDKLNCFTVILGYLLSMIWSGITAPFVYPIWYLFRKRLDISIYKGTSYQEISSLITNNKSFEAKQKLKLNGWFSYWIWTYSDLNDPINKDGFWKRYSYSAFRNPRFNINYINFRTGTITKVIKIIDTRNFKIIHKSTGISDSPDGIFFKWVKDDSNKWYLVY